MKICFLDNVNIPYTSTDIDSNQLRGAENVIINLTRELNTLGHEITVYNNCDKEIKIENIEWKNIYNIQKDKNIYDIVVTNNDMQLFESINANKYVAFSHSIQSLEKFIRKKQLIPFLKYKPKIVHLSKYHEQNRNYLLKIFGSFRLNWGLDEIFLKTNISNDNKENIAIFTSRVDRNLDLLINIWKHHIFTHDQNFKLLVTPNNVDLSQYNIFNRNFGSRKELINDLLKSKILLIPGHKSELYCIAAEQAKELCVPIITLGIGALAERVEHGKTGFIAKNEKEFASYTNDLFKNPTIFSEIKNNLLSLRGKNNWSDVAKKLILNILK